MRMPAILLSFLLHHGLQRVGRFLAAVPGFQRHAGDRLPGHVDLEHVLGFRMVEEGLVDLARIKLALPQRRVRRRDRLRQDDALILLRRELGMRGDEQKIDAAEHDQCEHDRDRQVVQAVVQAPLIAAMQPLEAAVDRPGEFFFPAAVLRVVGLEEPRAQHRRERERDDAGNGDGADQREGEFREQRAGQPALEADRHIDRGQHHRHRDDRAAELARGIDGGGNGGDAFLEMAADILDDDDGVVDDEADGEHERQQGEQIDRIAERQENNESADQRQRNGDGRNERRAHRAEEQEHDDRDDGQRLDQAAAPPRRSPHSTNSVES